MRSFKTQIPSKMRKRPKTFPAILSVDQLVFLECTELSSRAVARTNQQRHRLWSSGKAMVSPVCQGVI